MAAIRLQSGRMRTPWDLHSSQFQELSQHRISNKGICYAVAEHADVDDTAVTLSMASLKNPYFTFRRVTPIVSSLPVRPG
jgi:hypothetical protein